MSFTSFWLPENLQLSYFLMTLSIKKGRYAFLIRLDLMFLCHYEKVPITTNFKLLIYQTNN